MRRNTFRHLLWPYVICPTTFAVLNVVYYCSLEHIYFTANSTESAYKQKQMNDCSIFFSIISSRTLLRLPEKWARNNVSCYITVITDCESVSIFHRFSNLSSMMPVPNFRQVVLLRKHDFLLTIFLQKCQMHDGCSQPYCA